MDKMYTDIYGMLSLQAPVDTGIDEGGSHLVQISWIQLPLSAETKPHFREPVTNT